MNYSELLSRIMSAVDNDAYLTPSDAADPRQREALDEIGAMLRAPDFDVHRVRRRIRALHEQGALDRVHMLSALHVVAASPRVKEYAEAARLAGEQEFAALERGGPHMETHLASVDRHRGVLAFLQEQYGVALDHFTRALERERTPENIGNVLAALLRLGELEEAELIRAQVARSLTPSMVRQLQQRIEQDPDLAVLRS